jgi:dethiobiotin synthetase
VSLRGAVLVTGTDTGVGKTVVTAAIAAAAGAAGLRVAVVKPAQTGADSDVEEVVRLAAPAAAATLAGYPDPLAPLVAAREAGLPPLALAATVAAVRAQVATHDLVLVEGAGGFLVPMGLTATGQVWTVADLAVALGAPAVVVTRAGLGTLNHTALTLEALQRRAIPAHVVIGAWPAEPERVHRTNLSELRHLLAGAVPEGAGAMEPNRFRVSAPGWLKPRLHGTLDDQRDQGPGREGSTFWSWSTTTGGGSA